MDVLCETGDLRNVGWEMEEWMMGWMEEGKGERMG